MFDLIHVFSAKHVYIGKEHQSTNDNVIFRLVLACKLE